jgi:hypothetical protein
MMIIFFDIRDVIMIEFAPEGQIVSQKYCLEVLTKLLERLRKKRSELWKKKSCILQQDNKSDHDALAVKLLADKWIPVLEHPPSPHLIHRM